MGCNCNDKTSAKLAAKMAEDPQIRQAMYCLGCGIDRLLPSGLREGDEFTLVPCPKCGVGFRGLFTFGGVQEIR